MSYMGVRCSLSQDANRFDIRTSEDGGQKTRRVNAKDNVHPLVKEALECKTYAAVIHLLKRMGECHHLGGGVTFEYKHGSFTAMSGPESIMGSIKKYTNILNLQKLREVQKRLIDGKAVGNVTFWGKRVIQLEQGNPRKYTVKSTVDPSKLYKHIMALPQKKDGDAGIREDLLERLRWCTEDSYRACKMRNIFTRFLFWLRGGYKAERPSPFTHQNFHGNLGDVEKEKVRDFLYFLRKKNIDIKRPVEIKIGDEDGYFNWQEEDIHLMCLKTASRPKWYSEQDDIEFLVKDIVSIKNCDSQETISP